MGISGSDISGDGIDGYSGTDGFDGFLGSLAAGFVSDFLESGFEFGSFFDFLDFLDFLGRSSGDKDSSGVDISDDDRICLFACFCSYDFVGKRLGTGGGIELAMVSVGMDEDEVEDDEGDGERRFFDFLDFVLFFGGIGGDLFFIGETGKTGEVGCTLGSLEF